MPLCAELQGLIGPSYTVENDSTYVQERPAQNFVQGAGLIGQGGSFGRPAFF